ncbi:DUF5643 domain-containing protein [Clostridium paraputrificum]|uniref:DUF5643 domain-containing protein n=1 Tax=Clostridium TaxID=1485 RepID=UPI003D34C55B
MDKKFFEMMNDAEVDLNKYEIEEMTDLEKKKYKKKFKSSLNVGGKFKKSVKKVVIASGMVFIVTIGLLQTTGGQVVFAEVAKSLGIKGNYNTENITYLDPESKYEKIINGSVEKDGFKVSLAKAVRDGDLFKIYKNIERAENIEEYRYITDYEVYINDKKVENRNVEMSEVTEDDYKLGIAACIDLDKLELGDTFNVKLDVYRYDSKAAENEIDGDNNEMILKSTKEKIGTLEFEVDNKAYQESIKYIPINKEYTLKNGDKVTIEKLSMTSVVNKFYYKKDLKENSEITDMNKSNIQLVVTDEYGNEITGNTWGMKSEGSIRIVDRDDVKQLESEGKARKLDENAKELTVKVKAHITPENPQDPWGEWEIIDEFKLDISEINK